MTPRLQRTIDAGRRLRTTAKGLEAYGYQVVVDQEKLNGLIGQAAKNRTGKANCGPVRVRITERVLVP